MKTESLANRSWDDLVFENRHKEYGAYSLRQEYSRNISIGFAGTVTLALAIIFVPRLFPATPLAIIDELPIVTTPVNVTEVPRIAPPPKKEEQVRSEVPKGPSRQAPQVTTREVTTVPPTVDELNTAPVTSSPNGTEGATVSSVGTAVEGPAAPAIDTSKPFDIVEQMPAYEDGQEGMMRYLSKKIRFPASARRAGVEGTVYVSFVVNSMGKVTDVKVVRGISTDCDNEAARVVGSMPGWTAGVQNGIPVSVRMVVPIKFKFNQN